MLGTGVLILPQRSPVVCAKECATVDALSGGRMRLGVGVGWLREEAEAVGTSFEDRGARTDEYIEAMRVLWRDPEPTFHGTFTHFDRAKSNPKPAQRGGVPILVGGHSGAAARRAGRLGDGYFPIGLRHDDFAGRVEQMPRRGDRRGPRPGGDRDHLQRRDESRPGPPVRRPRGVPVGGGGVGDRPRLVPAGVRRARAGP